MPRTFTQTFTVYQFDELSDAAKEEAINRLSDWNVDHDWWDHIYEDAETIGLKITGFDLYGSTITGSLVTSVLDSCKAIRSNHGKECETYKTAAGYLCAYIEAFKAWAAKEDPDEYIDRKRVYMLDYFEGTSEAEEVTDEFKRELLGDYLSMLSKEYDYQTSREQIAETIRANEIEFNVNGVPA